jgi:hypothetical protein
MTGEAQKVLTSLQGALKAAAELRVITYVGDLTVNLAATETKDMFTRPPDAAPARVFLTSVNLVQGDIMNVLPANFGTELDKTMLTFHAEQVKEGKEIVARNLEMIGRLGKELARFIKE